jgi:hypothetical protein
VIISVLYLLVRCLLGCLTVLTRHRVSKDAELLVLRHENAVLRRQIGRVRYEPADRLWLAALSGLVPRRRWGEVFPVTPATLFARHRRLVARKWAGQARPPDRRLHGVADPARRRDRFRAPPRRPDLEAVPGCAGPRHHRRRLRPRGHRAAAARLRADRDRARQPPCPPGRHHRQPGRRVDDAGRPQLPDGPGPARPRSSS